MSNEEKNPIKIEAFLKKVATRANEGMAYSDAIHICALDTSGTFTSLVTQAIDKYQESIYEQTKLSQQENVDECALASMGTLWHGENFEGSSEYIVSSKEEIILDSLYFILKYSNTEKPLEEALAANERVCGDKVARARLIELAFPA